MKFIAILALLLSTQANAQTSGAGRTSLDATFKATVDRAQAVGQASDSLSLFGTDKTIVMNFFINACQKAVYEAARKKTASTSIDIISDADVRICVEDLAIVLGSYVRK